MGTNWRCSNHHEIIAQDIEKPFLPISQLPPLDFTSGGGYYDYSLDYDWQNEYLPMQESFLLDVVPPREFSSTCTPQSSMSKLPPITPLIDKSNYVIHDEFCLPPELCSICSNGFKEMKDMLITISNELIDKFNDLSPTHLEKLRRNRLELKKQIQQLEQYLRPKSAEKISKKVLSQYYYMLMTQAAKELNVGVTFLKKRCRELSISRWPHRKLMSLQTVIKNVQELGKREGEENELKLKSVIELLERERKLVEKNPDYQLDDTTQRLRRVYFKANWKKRKLMNMMESICHQETMFCSSSGAYQIIAMEEEDQEEEDEIKSLLSNPFSSNNLLF